MENPKKDNATRKPSSCLAHNSPCTRTDSVHQERRSESERWCCRAGTARRDPIARPSLCAGLGAALGTNRRSWWPSPPASHRRTPSSAWLLRPAANTADFHLYRGRFAEALVAAPPGGEAAALSTQTFRAGTCERRAIAAAAVHRLCLPAPAEHPFMTTHTGCPHSRTCVEPGSVGTSRMTSPPARPS